MWKQKGGKINSTQEYGWGSQKLNTKQSRKILRDNKDCKLIK